MQLFGSMKDLFVIHNMGSGCPYCTLWADGYNGIYEHLTSRAAFVIASPDSPAAQQRFAWHVFDLLPEGRGRWQPKFRYGRSKTAPPRGETR